MNGEYLAKMEDVLEVYNQEPVEDVDIICFDERPCQLIEDVYVPLAAQKGKVKKIDHTYKRKGTCALMLAYDIQGGIRYVQVSKQRRKVDYAHFMDWLDKTHYQHSSKVLLVQDNLNTHAYGSFYEHLPADRASELRNKYEFHFTPKNASWLNMAEIEFSSAVRQCLKKRIGSMEQLTREINQWAAKRNQDQVKISWSFTVPKARTKLKRQYDNVLNNL